MMRAALLVLGSFLALSCAGRGPGVSTSKEVLPDRIPIQLSLEKEISGRVMGYDLLHPAGVAVDAQGNLYISDSDNHRLIQFDRQFNPVREFGGYGSDAGRFISPEDIVVDRGLNVYVLDTGNRRIVQLDARLNYVEEISPQDDSAEIISNRGKLSGLVISPSGELTVADYDNSRLIKMDNFNRFSRYVGDFGYGRGALLNPMGLAIDRKDRTYVADAGNGRIAVYDDYGNYLSEIGRGLLRRPAAVAVSPYGTVWVADQDLGEILAFGADGRLLFRTGQSDMKSEDLSGVTAIAVSADDLLYVADGKHSRVLIFRIVYEGNR
jgi:DNA-binding beta-propeller fold protein YncE